MASQQIFVLGSDGNLWLEDGPFGKQIPPPRVPVDGSVDLYAAFQAFQWNEVLVCGSDGNLWFEQGPFGTAPLPDSSSFPPAASSRFQIDGHVSAFWPWSEAEIFVLGSDGNLWLEFGFGSTVPAVPPPRTQIDGSVAEFQPMSLREVFVLGQDGNLWHELAPFGTVPLPPCNGGGSGCRSQVDANVHAFWAVDSEHVFVVDNDKNLWLDQGLFDGRQIPPPRVHVDGDVAGIWAVDSETVYVLGTDGNLWLEHAPFGTVPLPPCSQTSGFGKGFGCRDLIYSNVDAFGVFADAGGVFVIDGNLDLWQLGAPNTQIDGSVITFQPLTPEQALLRKNGRSAAGRPVRAVSSLPRKGG